MSSLNDGTGDPKPKADDVKAEVKHEVTIKDESAIEEPPVVLADDKGAVKAIKHGEEDLGIVVPIPEPNNVEHEPAHKK
jgi:hypothetical protein